MKRYLRTLADVLRPTLSTGPCGPVRAGARLVMGSATNYELDDVRAFVLSLRRHFGGDICIFVNRRSQDLRSFLAEHRVDAPVVEDLPFHFSARVELMRYAYFLWYLRQAPVLPENVLLTDTRDVLFQGDPFADASTDTLHYFTEANDVALRRHPTGEWITSTFSHDITALLADRPCICCGTIIGPGDRMISLLSTILSLAAIPRFAQANSFGIDQAIVNYIAYFGLLAPSEIHNNFGSVATLGLVGSRELRLAELTIFNPDGTVSPIVHQYDRHPLLWDAVVKHYRLGMTRRMQEAEDDKRGEWRRRLRLWSWAVVRRVPELR
jgi:hypothetical protein